jgi:hypothetical protein
MIYIFTYGIYIFISVFVTVYVGYKLHRDGGVWIASLMDDKSMAVRLNDLLLMGYYLVNIGLIFYTFSTWGELENWMNSLHLLSRKVGLILLLLGYLHYQNIILINIFFTFKHTKKWKL